MLFVIPSLAGGGAEKVLVSLLQELDRAKIEPLLAVFMKEGPHLASIPPDVRLANLRKKSRWSFLGLVIRLARLIRAEQPDVVVSFLWYANVVSTLARFLSRTPTKLVVSEHNTSSANLSHGSLSLLKHLAVSVLYRWAWRIVCVSSGVAQDLVTRYRLPPAKMVVIYNPIDLERIRTLAQEPLAKPLSADGKAVIVAVGRLEPQKGYRYLIEALAEVNATIDAKLVILGQGSLREELANLAAELGVADRVQFLGFQSNPYRYMARADVFVLSSLWEGFGIVVVEAMACGVPVVATDCRSGPSETITHGINGLLVPVGDARALAQAIRRLLEDKALATGLAANARARAEAFDLPTIVRQWESLLNSETGNGWFGRVTPTVAVTAGDQATCQAPEVDG